MVELTGKRVVIAGGSGFLGRSLAGALIDRGDEVVILTRSPSPDPPPPAGPRHVAWDGRTVGEWARWLDGAEAVVNLAGKNVNCRYTPQALREINESRVQSVQAVAEAIGQRRHQPRVWVQASSLAIYGDAGDRLLDESAPPGEGDPVDTCLAWEGAFNAAASPGVRQVLLRIGFVLGKGEGALRMLAGLTRWGLGGRVGSGRQFISWIHLRDMNRLFLRAIDDESMHGVYNATSPTPVTNAQFMRGLRHALHRPWSPPAPTWAVRIGAWIMRTEPVLALTGRRCLPRRLLDEGFTFNFPDLPTALRDQV